jgi:hypothetical protein
MLDCTLSGVLGNFDTHAEEAHLLVRYAASENADLWSVLADRLIEWSAFAGHVDDDGIEWPGKGVLALAGRVAYAFRDKDMPAPSNIVPSGDGGVVIEWKIGAAYLKIEIGKDGSLEKLAFDHGKLVSREPLLVA